MTITGTSPDNNPMKAMFKSELARAAGVSRWTLNNWLQDPRWKQYPELKRKRKIPGYLLKLICEHYVIDIS